jgi:hypothetical protein
MDWTGASSSPVEIEKRRLSLALKPRTFHSPVQNDDLESKVEAEVDTEKRQLKSLYYDDKAYWNHPPIFDLPITLSKNSGK